MFSVIIKYRKYYLTSYVEEVRLKEQMSEKCCITFAKLQTKPKKKNASKDKKNVSFTHLLAHGLPCTHLTTQQNHLFLRCESEINYPFCLTVMTVIVSICSATDL